MGLEKRLVIIFAHILVIIFSLLLSLCAVHGFDKESYNVTEDSSLATTFSLNVKGETTLLGAVAGEVISLAGGTARKLMLHDSVCIHGMFQ